MYLWVVCYGFSILVLKSISISKMTEPTEEIDKLLWFPTKVTELTKIGVADVVPKTVALLPEYQRNRVLRDLELSMNRELKTLTEAEQKHVETQMDSLGPQTRTIIFNYMNPDDEHLDYYKLHKTEKDAAKALFDLVSSTKCFIKQNNMTVPKSLEESLKMIQLRRDFAIVCKRGFYESAYDAYEVLIKHHDI